MIKKNKIPTILGILLLFVGVFAGVFLLKNNQIFKIGASSGIPKDVRIGNLTDSSVTISWVTSEAATCFISYGTNENVGNVASETEDGQKFLTHSITITGLSPGTNYYFKINSNGTAFDNNAIPWQFTTGKSLSTNQTSVSISGSVITASGQPSKRALVYITVNGYLTSTLTSDSGNFVLQLGSVRTPDLSSYAKIDLTKTLLEVSVESDSGETATAKIFPQSANPIPALIIGQDQDFRNLEPTKDSNNPNADLYLPETATTESKINLSGSQNTSTKNENVTLESVTEGEMITSNQPEFFGDGPTGEKVTITVHSDTEITGTATVGSNGSWKWSPPTDLSEGAHVITVSWIDALGITRTLTRNFIVQAGELPSFVATPSATTAPTKSPSPTATPKASPTATPAVTKSPTPKPTVTPTKTSETLPQSGSLTPTLVLFIMGIGTLSLSFAIWKMSEDKIRN